MRMMVVSKHQSSNFKVVFIIAIRIMLFLKDYIFNRVTSLFFGLEDPFYYLELLCTEIYVFFNLTFVISSQSK